MCFVYLHTKSDPLNTLLFLFTIHATIKIKISCRFYCILSVLIYYITQMYQIQLHRTLASLLAATVFYTKKIVDLKRADMLPNCLNGYCQFPHILLMDVMVVQNKP